MPIKYKIDVLAELKNAGYSSYRLRQDKIFGERTIQKFRNKEIVSADNLATLCELLNCQLEIYLNTRKSKKKRSKPLKACSLRHALVERVS